MTSQNQTPKDLAKAVCLEIRKQKKIKIDLKILTSLFETLYFTSLKTEEGNFIACDIIWLDQRNELYEVINLQQTGGHLKRPGLFHSSISGVGHIVAYYDVFKVAELKVNKLINFMPFVLRKGPIRDYFQPFISKYVDEVKDK